MQLHTMRLALDLKHVIYPAVLRRLQTQFRTLVLHPTSKLQAIVISGAVNSRHLDGKLLLLAEEQ